MKNYLIEENERNQANHHLYERLMRLALGQGTFVLVAHHLTFETPVDGGAMSSPNEVPSADTLIFCHDLMGRAFGEGACYAMTRLASRPVVERDRLLAELVEEEEERRRVRVQSVQTNPCISGG